MPDGEKPAEQDDHSEELKQANKHDIAPISMVCVFFDQAGWEHSAHTWGDRNAIEDKAKHRLILTQFDD